MFVPRTQELKALLREAGISTRLDDGGSSVGKRYARTDEMGIPYAFTIDHQSIEDGTVTMREIISMKQVRLPISEGAETIAQLT